MKARITYKNTWNEIKTIIIEEDTYFEIIQVVNSMFGAENIVNIEDLDPKPKLDYETNTHDDTWDWLNVD
jgi:hypothetical protein